MSDGDVRRFPLGDVALTGGGRLRQAQIAYQTFGQLNPARDNAILLPTYFTGTHRSYEPLIGPGRALDPDRWFILIPNMFGNGVSSSPSLSSDPTERHDFPAVSIRDNVLCQRRLVEELGIRRIALVGGWSLGAVQAYGWAALFPDMVDGLLPFCGAARCWPNNRVFLAGLRAILAMPGVLDDAGSDISNAALRAFGRVYAGWAYSPRFFRDQLYRHLGHRDEEAFLIAWEKEHLAWHPRDLLAMLDTWTSADLDAVELAAIRAQAIVMPCTEDRYFTLDENRLEAARLTQVELRPLASPYGHCAGAPGRFAEETHILDRAFSDLLSRVRAAR